MKKQYVIWGATGQSIMIHDTLCEDHELIAVFDNNSEVLSPFDNVPIYHTKKGFAQWKEKKDLSKIGFVVGIAGGNGKIRHEVHQWLKGEGLIPLNVISKSAYIGHDVIIGEGCQILPNATICPRVTIGETVIINTSSSVDHECELGNGVHIGPGAKLAGCIHVKDYTFVGTNATILPRLIIGNSVTVGAGAVVTKDVPNYKITVGVPAKFKN